MDGSGIPAELDCHIAVIGAGVGGFAAALAVLRRGLRVVLTEETDWIGGQLTSQAVPPDEHPWIEQFGCTASYRAFREQVRDYYRRWYPLTTAARLRRDLNPGVGSVSKLAHEPRVSLAVLEALLAPYRASAMLTVLVRHRPVGGSVDNDRVEAVVLADEETGSQRVVHADYFIDATECGDLLELLEIEHVSGSESREQTGEPHGDDAPRPQNIQAFTLCFALDHLAGADLTIDRPESFDYWKSYRSPIWPGPVLGLDAPDPRTLLPRTHTFVPNPPSRHVITDQSEDPDDVDLWTYRRVLARESFEDGSLASDVTMVNWPMSDYWGGSLLTVEPDLRRQQVEAARQMSLSLLFWLQTEAPRPDGGTGWPGLRLRPDITGSTDGFAKAPYIRESRRIAALYTVVEQDLSYDVRGEAGAVVYPDRVGVGSYRIDLHPSTGGDTYIDIASCPFQIPLRSLIPVRVRNLLAGAKNIGTTHITNGCYRMHPTEWNIGEVAGSVAAYCLQNSVGPVQAVTSPSLLGAFQQELAGAGVELEWPKVHGY
jgi:hypothetical protein